MKLNFRAESPALSYQRIHPSLIDALADLTYWQAAKNRFHTGTTRLIQEGQQWMVKASSDLVDKILPF